MAEEAAAAVATKPAKPKRGKPFGTDGHKGVPFKPGESGHPGGRARDTFGPMVREFLEGFEELADGVREQRGMLLIKKLFQQAVGEGNVRATTELLNRGFGLPSQHVEVDINEQNRQIEEIARRYGKDRDWARKRAQELGIVTVKTG